jgi:NAD(P)-dependent dehydrogenase (short-subunit alcohol dehydrogenase family)
MPVRTWLITGVSSGFGRELTRQLLEPGDRVAHIIATNLTGSIQLVRVSLPHLRGQGGGRIIQLSSYGGQVAFAGNSLYHATKWGIEGFCEAVAQEVAGFGIGVTIVEPARMATAMIASVDIEPAPLRMILGSQALDNTVEALRERIAGFEAQRELAASTDFPAGA